MISELIVSSGQALRPDQHITRNLRLLVAEDMVPFPGKEGTRPVGTGAERRRVCWGNAPHSECGGAGHDRTWRSSRPCYARRLNFHVRLVCAHSPNSPVGVASAPFGAASAGVVRRLGRNGLKRPRLLRIFRISLGLQSFGLTHGSVCLLYYILGFTLLASSSAACAFALACIAASFHAAWRRQAPHSPLTLHAPRVLSGLSTDPRQSLATRA